MDNNIDFVITWVDGSDPAWIEERSRFCGAGGDRSETRFRDWGLLPYWFRAVEKYAPWVRTIHFVTWGHIPDWLDTDNPKIHVVKHSDFIPEKYLPTFNSHTIELNLHRIPGLSEQFVYFNDDVFLNRPVKPTYFFKNGLPRDCFSLECIPFSSKTIGWIAGSSIGVINDNFPMKETVKRNRRKYFSPRNGIKKVIKTALLIRCCKDHFPNFHHWHLSFSFLKSTFDEVWDAAYDTLDETCSCRFREKTNVSPSVIRNWQLARGKFIPRSVDSGRCYHLTDKRVTYLVSNIRNRSSAVICANDADRLTDPAASFERIRAAFSEKLPDRSSFEK